MSFMELEVTPKGMLCQIDCGHCGAIVYIHEHVDEDFWTRRAKMRDGTAVCPECAHVGTLRVGTMTEQFAVYAARYSAPGYLDCTDWEYGTNYRELTRRMRREYS